MVGRWMGGVAWRGKNFPFPSIVCETKVFRKKIEKKIFISIFLSTLGKINILIEAMTLFRKEGHYLRTGLQAGMIIGQIRSRSVVYSHNKP